MFNLQPTILYCKLIVNYTLKYSEDKEANENSCNSAEVERMNKILPNLDIENKYHNKIICGVDEAGRGPLAGPVVAAAVIIDQKNIIANINDSKKITQQKREILYEQITNNYIWSVGIVCPEIIDEINILEATKQACATAVQNLKLSPEIILVDGNMKFSDERFISIIKGDTLSISIAAASIIAKVTRDNLMQELSKKYPLYKWDRNFGYGTAAHIGAIRTYGFSPEHRKSFKIKPI